MATTTILDIVKVSELAVVNRLTDTDYLIVNDVQDSGVVESKTIVINDLAISVSERTSLRQLKDVSPVSPGANQILRWNGSEWAPSNESDSGLKKTDISVFNETTPDGGGKLEYDNNLGVFTFFPADVYGPISNHNDVSSQAPVNGDVLTWSELDNNWYPADAIDLNVIQRPADGKGTLVLDGNNLIYTPPYLEDFLTEEYVESDPFFRASPAADIKYIDISNWNTAHGWGDHAEAGYLKEVRLNDLTDVNVSNAREDNLLKFNESTRSWYPGTSVVKKLGDIENVVTGGVKNNDVIKWKSSSKVWASEENTVLLLSDVNSRGLAVGSVLRWSGIEWRVDDFCFLTEVVAGSGLSGGGKATKSNGGKVRVDVNAGAGLRFSGDNLVVASGTAISTNGDKVNVIPGDAISTSGNKINVVAGNAIDVSGSRVNVREGDGLYIDSNNKLVVKAGAGLNNDSQGVYVKPGRAIDVNDDKVNVREGAGLFIDGSNNLVVNPGLGLSADSRGVFVNPGDAIDVNDDKVNVRVDNKTVKINSNNVLTAETGVKNGRVVWGVVDTFGNKVNVGSGDWGTFRYGYGRAIIKVPGANLKRCAVIVSDYDEEGDHISGCFGEPGAGSRPNDEVIIYSRDLQNLESRKAKALMDAIRAGETELPSIYDDAFDGWDGLDDSTPGISFMIIFPD